VGQTVSGITHRQGELFPGAAPGPQFYPVSAIDYLTGYLMAFGALVALALPAGGHALPTALAAHPARRDSTLRSAPQHGGARCSTVWTAAAGWGKIVPPGGGDILKTYPTAIGRMRNSSDRYGTWVRES
jgi:hypothetical protein